MDDSKEFVPASRRREAVEAALDDLLPMVATQQVPAAWLIRHLAHVYWNLRYIGVDRPLVARIERAKTDGAEWRDFKDVLLERYRREDATDRGGRCAAFHAALSLLPDHLLDAHGAIVWVAERPHATFEVRFRRPPSSDAADRGTNGSSSNGAPPGVP
ncbi:hypothetical protein EDM68_03260 [Candidatus Uhrbacteria bacterium]|nr:MAG: hypothetical protein EDM68_03260 [Candidatus Uhrbacteria bacterium]